MEKRPFERTDVLERKNAYFVGELSVRKSVRSKIGLRTERTGVIQDSVRSVPSVG